MSYTPIHENIAKDKVYANPCTAFKAGNLKKLGVDASDAKKFSVVEGPTVASVFDDKKLIAVYFDETEDRNLAYGKDVITTDCPLKTNQFRNLENIYNPVSDAFKNRELNASRHLAAELANNKDANTNVIFVSLDACPKKAEALFLSMASSGLSGLKVANVYMAPHGSFLAEYLQAQCHVGRAKNTWYYSKNVTELPTDEQRKYNSLSSSQSSPALVIVDKLAQPVQLNGFVDLKINGNNVVVASKKWNHDLENNHKLNTKWINGYRVTKHPEEPWSAVDKTWTKLTAEELKKFTVTSEPRILSNVATNFSNQKKTGICGLTGREVFVYKSDRCQGFEDTHDPLRDEFVYVDGQKWARKVLQPATKTVKNAEGKDVNVNVYNDLNRWYVGGFNNPGLQNPVKLITSKSINKDVSEAQRLGYNIFDNVITAPGPATV